MTSPNGTIKAFAIFCALCVFFSDIQSSFARDIMVFDVRKTLPLTSDEPVFRDFYLNGGTQDGIRAGMVITVNRKISLYDAYQNKSPGDLKVSVGRLKVIHAQETLSVARLYSRISRKSVPILGYEYIMVGDYLDMDTIEMDRGSRKTSSRPSSPKPKVQPSAKAEVKVSVAPKPAAADAGQTGNLSNSPQL